MHTYYMLLCRGLQPAVMLPQEELWKSLFSEPGMWYDKRPTMNNRPNFVHKQHHFSLWLEGAPEWVVKGIADADSAVEVLWEKVGSSSAGPLLAAELLLLYFCMHNQCRYWLYETNQAILLFGLQLCFFCAFSCVISVQ